jgi:hypothetical protein
MANSFVDVATYNRSDLQFLQIVSFLLLQQINDLMVLILSP